MFKSNTNSVFTGILLYGATHFSCVPAQESKWAMDILLQEEFVIYHSVDSIPKPLIDEISSPDEAIAIAEPGEVFNETSTLVEDLSSRRLMYAGQSDKHWFIYYEQAEWQRTENNMVLFEFTNEQVIPKIKLRFTYSYRAPNFTVLKRLIVNARKMTINTVRPIL